MWPAQVYVTGTHDYALFLVGQIQRIPGSEQKMYVYKGVLDDEPVWVVSWVPKKEKGLTHGQ